MFAGFILKKGKKPLKKLIESTTKEKWKD